MAYLPTSEKDKEDQKGQQEGGPTNETTLGGQGGVIGGGGGGVQQQSGPQTAPGQAGTGFVNLQRYISANRPGIGRMTDTTVGKIGETGQQAQQAKEGVIGAFDEQAAAARVQADQGILKNLRKDPTKITGNADTLAAFQRMQSGQYGGPKSMADVEGFQQAQGAVDKLGTTLGQTETSGGRYNLLRQYLGDPRYSQGENRLDQAFMQSDPNAQQKLAGVREQFNPTVEGFGERLNESQQQAQQFMSEAQATNQAVQQALGTARTKAEQQAAQRLAQQQAARDAQANQLLQAMGFGVAGQMGGGGDLSLDQINQALRGVGLNPLDLRGIDYGGDKALLNQAMGRAMSPGAFVGTSGRIGYGDAMTAQDFAKMEALGQLGGFDVTKYQPQQRQLGSGATFNQNAYLADVQNQLNQIMAARQQQQSMPVPEAQELAQNPARDMVVSSSTRKKNPLNPVNWF